MVFWVTLLTVTGNEMGAGFWDFSLEQAEGKREKNINPMTPTRRT
jgi:hypothetical protein